MWRQRALTYGHIGATRRILLNLCVIRPSPSAQPKRQIDRFSPLCTAHGRKFLGFSKCDPFPQIALLIGDLDSHLIHDSLSESELTNQRHDDRFSRFRTDDCRVSLYFTMCRPLPLKIAPSHGGSGPQSNTWFPDPTRVNPNGISIGSAVFAGLTSVAD